MSIRSILGGDILANDFFKRQTRLLILIMILTVLYIDTAVSYTHLDVYKRQLHTKSSSFLLE